MKSGGRDIRKRPKKLLREQLVMLLCMVVMVADVLQCARTPPISAKKIASVAIASFPHPRVRFRFDSDHILAGDISYVDENADWMVLNRNAVVILEGHCDEIGPKDYNTMLGDRRARAVKARMIGRGVPYNRIIMVVSLGETRPLDPAHNLAAWQANRRVEFVLR